jgi:hypothetical protein
MAPKKRSSPFSTQGSAQRPRQHGDADPAVTPTSPTVSKGRRRRLPQPRELGPGTSPVQSSTSRLVDPSLSSNAVADSPPHSSEGTVPESSSRRQSTSSTMRTSSIPMEGPSAQTPTGRISKAKKGKRVHACSFEGCGKVSQRAQSPSRDRSCGVESSVLMFC